MKVEIDDVTDILTRTISEHGIIHGLNSLPGRLVKIVVMDTPEPVDPKVPTISLVSEKPYPSQTIDAPPAPVKKKSVREPKRQPNRVVFEKESVESCPREEESDLPYSDETTGDHIRDYLSS